MWNWELCPTCDKPLVNEDNLRKLRKIIVVSGLGCGVLGAATLPLLGFGLGGVTAGSIAAGWQSYIGSVAARSLFATLQSLGATGLGIILTGSVAAGLGILSSCVARIGWCAGHDEDNNPDTKRNNDEKDK